MATIAASGHQSAPPGAMNAAEGRCVVNMANLRRSRVAGTEPAKNVTTTFLMSAETCGAEEGVAPQELGGRHAPLALRNEPPNDEPRVLTAGHDESGVVRGED